MSRRSQDLAERLRAFNDEIIEFVENCSDENWRKVCPWEQWTVGVAARHIGAGHYSAIGLAKMILDGEKLPELTMRQIADMANRHALEHADCSRPEVLDILRKEGRAAAQFVAGLDDSELDKTGYLSVTGKNITVERFIESVILESGNQHFENMKAAAKS